MNMRISLRKLVNFLHYDLFPWFSDLSFFLLSVSTLCMCMYRVYVSLSNVKKFDERSRTRKTASWSKFCILRTINICIYISVLTYVENICICMYNIYVYINATLIEKDMYPMRRDILEQAGIIQRENRNTWMQAESDRISSFLFFNINIFHFFCLSFLSTKNKISKFDQNFRSHFDSSWITVE